MFELRLLLFHEMRVERVGLWSLPALFWSTIQHVTEDVPKNRAIH